MGHLSCLLSTAATRLRCWDVASPLDLRKAGKQPRCLTACRSWHSNYEMLMHLWFIWFSPYYNKLNLCVGSRDHSKNILPNKVIFVGHLGFQNKTSHCVFNVCFFIFSHSVNIYLHLSVNNLWWVGVCLL